jgi:hypothetical protein
LTAQGCIELRFSRVFAVDTHRQASVLLHQMCMHVCEMVGGWVTQGEWRQGQWIQPIALRLRSPPYQVLHYCRSMSSPALWLVCGGRSACDSNPQVSRRNCCPHPLTLFPPLRNHQGIFCFLWRRSRHHPITRCPPRAMDLATVFAGLAEAHSRPCIVPTTDAAWVVHGTSHSHTPHTVPPHSARSLSHCQRPGSLPNPWFLAGRLPSPMLVSLHSCARGLVCQPR